MNRSPENAITLIFFVNRPDRNGTGYRANHDAMR